MFEFTKPDRWLDFITGKYFNSVIAAADPVSLDFHFRAYQRGAEAQELQTCPVEAQHVLRWEDRATLLFWFWFSLCLFLKFIAIKMPRIFIKELHPMGGSQPCPNNTTSVRIKCTIKPLLLGMFMCIRKYDILSHHVCFASKLGFAVSY